MKVTLYSTGCPRCTILRKKLDSTNLAYDVCMDIEKMTEMGIMSVPVLDTGDGKLLQFNEAVKWVNAQIESDCTG